MKSAGCVGGAVCTALLCSAAATARAGGVPSVQLDPIAVIGERTLADTTASATEGHVTQEQLE